MKKKKEHIHEYELKTGKIKGDNGKTYIWMGEICRVCGEVFEIRYYDDLVEYLTDKILK